MKIGFDGRYAEENLVGIGKYIVNLVKQLAKKDIQCVIFYAQKPKTPLFGKNISFQILPSKNTYHFEQIALAKALIKNQIDIYHAPGNLGVTLFSPVPTVLTVHDIIPILQKDYFHQSKHPYLSRLSYLFRLKTSLLKAKKIITDSKFTKNSLKSYFGRRIINKINVVYPGVSQIDYQSKVLPFNLEPRKYILNHGGIDIRKNLDNLIKAFAKILLRLPDFKLVITGENDRLEKRLKKEAKSLGIKKSVIFTGYVDEKTLWSLIKQANCLCYPSLLEGFGSPVLEGFAAGVPVITSNTSSLAEVAGQAACLINPQKEEEIIRAILAVIKNKNLRQKLVARGKQRSRQFSWQKAAEKIIRIYKGVKDGKRKN